jgi:Gas vesicle protein
MSDAPGDRHPAPARRPAPVRPAPVRRPVHGDPVHGDPVHGDEPAGPSEHAQPGEQVPTGEQILIGRPVPPGEQRRPRAASHEPIALIDLLDRVLAGGVVISGEVRLAIADVDLVTVSLQALVSSVSTVFGSEEEAGD